MANVDQLQNAGLVSTPNTLTPEQVEALNNLSSAEVDALISVKSKLEGPFQPLDLCGTFI